MEIGEYEIILTDGQGTSLSHLARTTRSGRPIVGERLEIDGEQYRVTDVLHRDDPAIATVRRYMFPIVFCAPIGGPSNPAAPSPADGDSASSSPGPIGAQHGRNSGRVLPFRHPQALKSEILPPGLVAVLVAVGYREQASAFGQAGHFVWKLVREQSGFLLASSAPEQAHRLSRRAKLAFMQALELIDEIAESAVPAIANEREIAHAA